MSLPGREADRISVAVFPTWRVAVTAVLLAPVLSAALHTEGATDPPWPPLTDGLAFVWENGAASNTIPTDGPVGELCRVIPAGQAKFDRFWAMDVTGGAFRAEPETSAGVLRRLRVSRQLTLAAVVMPASADGDQTVHIVSCGTASVPSLFVLAQRGDVLLLGLRESAPKQMRLWDVGQLQEGRARHVAVTIADGLLTAYLDGRQVSTYGGVSPDFSGEGEPQLWFGAAPDGSSDWSGRLEGIAIYNRALSHSEVERHYQAYAERLMGRTPLPTLEVDALLTRKRDIPRATAYPDTLVVFDYRVIAIREGVHEEGPALVAHWGNLNGRRQLSTEELRVGDVHRLRLEPFAAHPELAALQIVMNLDDLDLPLFYATSAPTRTR